MEAKIIVTGATGSMGKAAVRALVSKGESVIGVCRSQKRAELMEASIRSEFPDAKLSIGIADLSSIASVKEFAASLEGQRIKGLFNNAGTLNRDFSLSKDGIEMCVAVNYVAPFILCNRIGAMMEAGGHIVNMISLTCRFAKLDGNFFLDGSKEYSQLGTYAKSKLALMMFTMEFARRHPELIVNVADPGVVNSNMISMGRWFDPLADVLFRPFCKSPENGVAPALRALEAKESGKLYVGDSIRDIPKKCRKYSDVNELWKETLKLV